MVSQQHLGYMLAQTESEPSGPSVIQSHLDSAPFLRAPLVVDEEAPSEPRKHRESDASRTSRGSNKKRLQKFTPNWKTLVSKRSQSDKNGFDSSIRVVSRPTPIVGQHILPGQTLLPTPASFRDSNWLDLSNADHYDKVVKPVASVPNLSSESRARRPPPPPPAFTQDPSMFIVEERTPRPSLDSSSTLSPTSSTSTSSSMKQQSAKTPFFTIGDDDFLPKREHWQPRARSSVERIAEQYRAFLEARDDKEEQEETQSDPAGAEHDFRDFEIELLPRRHYSEDSPRPVFLEQTYPSQEAASAPSSDDGTLVSMEEDAIYFKPVSFSPTSSPSPERQRPKRDVQPAPSPDSLGLKICLDLLTRELTSAFTERSDRVGREPSAMQVWVMIEAYERLQNQVANMDMQENERLMMGTIFNSFLAALYSVHDTLSRKADVEHLAEDVD